MRKGQLIYLLTVLLLGCVTGIPHGEPMDGIGERVSSWRDVQLLPPADGDPECPHEILKSVRTPATKPGFSHLDELRQAAWSLGGQAVIYAVWDETGAEGTVIRFKSPKCMY
jgi:hypothetical protein